MKLKSMLFSLVLLLVVVPVFAQTPSPAPGSTINLGTVSTAGPTGTKAQITGLGSVSGFLLSDTREFGANIVNVATSKHSFDSYVDVSCFVPLSFGTVSEPPTVHTATLAIVTSSGTFSYTLQCNVLDTIVSHKRPVSTFNN
jgi:hypothetical protein